MNPSATFEPKRYTNMHQNLSGALNRRAFYNDGLEEGLIGASAAAAMLENDPNLSIEDNNKYATVVNEAEDKIGRRKLLREDISAQISPTVKAMRRVGGEVRSKKEEISRIKEDYSIEIAKHKITEAKHAALLQELHQAERFIDVKNELISELRKQIEDLKVSGMVTEDALTITKSTLLKSLGQTEEEVTKLQAAVENIKAIKFEKRNFPEIKTPATITPTPEEKKEKPLSPKEAENIVRGKTGALATLTMHQGNADFKERWGGHVEKMIKILDRLEDEALRNTLVGELNAALNVVPKKPESAKAPEPKVAPVPKPEATAETPPTAQPAEAEVKRAAQTEKRVSAAKGALGALGLVMGTAGFMASQTPEKYDAATRIENENRMILQAEQEQTVEKIGNITIDTRVKTITLDEKGGVTMLLKTLEKKDDYYVGTIDVNGYTENIVIPPADILRSASLAINEEDAKVIVSPFANRVLIENPWMKGVSIFTCQIGKNEEGEYIFKMCTFKNQNGKEIKEAKDRHITLEENVVAKEIFGKKYGEYVGRFKNKNMTLNEFKALDSNKIEGIEDEVIELGNKLASLYKKNGVWDEGVWDRKIDDLLSEIPR